MQVHLAPVLVERLMQSAETGMGYHVVDLVLRDGTVVRNVVVLNSEVVELAPALSDISSDDIVDVRLQPRSGQLG